MCLTAISWLPICTGNDLKGCRKLCTGVVGAITSYELRYWQGL